MCARSEVVCSISQEIVLSSASAAMDASVSGALGVGVLGGEVSLSGGDRVALSIGAPGGGVAIAFEGTVDVSGSGGMRVRAEVASTAVSVGSMEITGVAGERSERVLP